MGASKSRRVARPNRQGEGLIVEYTEIWGPAVWGPGFQGIRGHENCSIFKVSCILDAFYDNLKVTDLVLPRTQALWFVYVIKRTWDGTRGRKTEIILCHTDENITRLRPPPPTFLLSFGRITKFVRKKSGGSRNPPPPCYAHEGEKEVGVLLHSGAPAFFGQLEQELRYFLHLSSSWKVRTARNVTVS